MPRKQSFLSLPNLEQYYQNTSIILGVSPLVIASGTSGAGLSKRIRPRKRVAAASGIRQNSLKTFENRI
jgi:hypothetical protein